MLFRSGVENVLEEPLPKVQFIRFGEYSLDFRLLVWTSRPSRHPQIRSDINYRVKKLTQDRGIVIPFPTHEFLLKGINLPGAEDLHDRITEEKVSDKL